jgi:hypothetical protein
MNAGLTGTLEKGWAETFDRLDELFRQGWSVPAE